METSLIIMAAGIGSRFGTEEVKQLAPVGPNNEVIMDYSVHDAIKAGFNNIIFVIREDILDRFREAIGYRLEAVCKKAGVHIDYCFQKLDALPDGFSLPDGRTKPWGTCQAVLAAKEKINTPFAVINADDYYGKKAYEQIHSYLIGNIPQGECAIAGFILENTLSENGGVTRGVCEVNGNTLTKITETKNIVKTKDGAQSGDLTIDPKSYVSMNFWGFDLSFMDRLEEGFKSFLSKEENLSGEFLIPVYVGELLKEGKMSVKILPTEDKWFGVTYKEDKAAVCKSFDELIKNGVYSKELYSDV